MIGRGASSLLERLGTAWVARAARPDPSALAAVAGVEPAVVVTGASRGIGLAIARAFAGAGSAVMMVARGQAALDVAAGEVRAAGRGHVVPVVLDVTRDDAAERLRAEALANGLYIDVLVNNAGLGLAGPYCQQAPTEIDRLLMLNIVALSRTMRALLPDMLARGRGGIMNVASLGAYAPGPYQAAYYASKAYVVSLTDAVAHECRGLGVRICVVSPGPVETGFHAAMGAQGALYRLLVPAASTAAVARAALRGYRLGQTVIVPGLLPPVLRMLMHIVPRAILVPIVGIALQTSHDPDRSLR